MKNYIKEQVSKLHINLSDEKCEQFVQFYNMLIEYNSKCNLTSITDFEDVVLKHFVDSLSIVNIIDMNSECTVVDVGTGGGFPGIPLKIAFPTIKLTMIDSLDKRITFLNNVIKELSLFNTCAIHTRAEEYGHTKARDSFDICVTRAVSNLSVISEYCLPLVKPGGCFIPYKSGAIKEEIDKYEIAVEELGGVIDDVAIFELPDSDIMRSLCLIYKDGDTPKKYPRKNGIPLKRPLM
ncbi:MAG: 16S rRNA (guanine(527)-N(7))-methyltransferase RsmG [Lachnospiraceae bacterium]|nr:16S rRNA (guanine(527)-N(7))-methyltransferase RsmG [Lachnospiraceae bacterium]